MSPLLKALLRPGPGITVGVGVAAAFIGWPILGGLVVLSGVGVAYATSRGPQAQLTQALNEMGIVLDESTRMQLTALVPALKSAQTQSGSEQIGMQAYEQVQSITRNFLSYRSILRQRFDPTELTHSRYLAAGEQVFLAALDDLQRVSAQLQGLATVDVDQMRAQLRILERLENPRPSEERERDTLRERMALREEETETLKGLLANNEQALTQLSAAHAALARVQTTQGLAKLESTAAMKELEILSERAERYQVESRS